MISAIVVSKDTMLPGYGFFKLGQELRQVEPGEDEIAFAVRQIRRVHDYWAGDAKQRNTLVAEDHRPCIGWSLHRANDRRVRPWPRT